MHFTSSGIARKNGFRFEIIHSGELNGIHQDNPWYLHISLLSPPAEKQEECCTEYSLRFVSKEDAQVFCERIADGQISFSKLQGAETAAYAQYQAKMVKDAEREVDLLISNLRTLNVPPHTVPDVHHLLSDLSQNAQSLALNRDYLNRYQESNPRQSEMNSVLRDVFFEYCRDMDICLLDKDLGDHFLPAICYLDPTGIEEGLFDYTPKEKWLLSLPISHISLETDCPLAVLKTEFTHEQVEFLLGIPQFDSIDWAERSMRAIYAGADFSARLSYLKDGTPFEVLFDGTCMDACDPQQRSDLCKLLSEHEIVYITTFPGVPDDFYAYAIEKGPHGRTITSEFEVPISYTEPGKGLTSTLEGKIAWAQHVAQCPKSYAQAPAVHTTEIEQGGINT